MKGAPLRIEPYTQVGSPPTVNVDVTHIMVDGVRMTTAEYRFHQKLDKILTLLETIERNTSWKGPAT